MRDRRWSMIGLVILSVGFYAPLQAQLTLPYSGTDSSSTAYAFQITKSGSGGATKFIVTNPSTSGQAMYCETVGSGIAVYGFASKTTGATTGVYGRTASTTGRGVVGVATATTGVNYGGLFESSSPSGVGLWAVNTGGIALKAQSSTGTALVVAGTSTFSGTAAFNGSTPFTVSTTTKVTNLNADLLDGLNSTAFLSSNPPITMTGNRSGSHIIKGSNSSTGVGSSGVFGESTATSGATYGVYGLSTSTAGYGIFGRASASSGTTFGVYGLSDSTTGRGVFGRASASSGINYGVYGQSDSGTGIGVYGIATPTSGTTFGVQGVNSSTSGTGVQGYASATSGSTYGVVGKSDSTDGTGVYGAASTTSGANAGVIGTSASDEGKGVFGLATASTGTNYGIFGQSDSTSGVGVFGIASAGSGNTFGVLGESNSTGGMGVFGHATAISGVTYGVFGQSDSGTGWGVYAYGESDVEKTGGALRVFGNFEHSSGAFRASPTTTEWTTSKPATVKLDDGTKIKLYAEEAAEIYFTDYGIGQLVNGRARIQLDPKFAQTVTVNDQYPMMVFVQLEGECNGVYVANKTASGFDVIELRGGRSNASFSYRVVCHRKYYEGARLSTEAEDAAYNTRMLQIAWPELLNNR